jgi:MinD-like ATPase involved in chromosome partitioning or flagellar assembly
MTKNVTFWSYKGGVGRTMALVNTAFQLARQGERVLVWEMDLEAPGLLQIPMFHEFGKTVKGGMVDILEGASERLDTIVGDVRRYVARYRDSEQETIAFDVLAAGAPNGDYFRRYAGLEWSKFFGPNTSHGYFVFEAIQQTLARTYQPDIILIDSRTGVTDLSAVCTVQIPDTVVMLFTLSHQGIEGTAAVNRAIERRSRDTRRSSAPIERILVASMVPAGSPGLIQQRVGKLRSLGIEPTHYIQLQEDLLLEEQVVSRGSYSSGNYRVFKELAERLLANKSQPRESEFPRMDAEDARRQFDAILGQTSAESPLLDRARCVARLMALLRDLAPSDFVPANPRFPAVIDSLSALFEVADDEPQDPKPWRLRVQAAEILGADHPRLRLPHQVDYWVHVPGGKRTDGAFTIGRYPATVFEYDKFVEDGGRAPADWKDQRQHPGRPVVNVSFRDAKSYCDWAGVRLLTREEWFQAAFGDDERAYPWGSAEITPNHANYRETGIGAPSPVGVFPRGNNPQGIADLVGNVVQLVGGGIADGAQYGEWRCYTCGAGYGWSPEDSSPLTKELTILVEEAAPFIGFRCARP